MQVIVLKLCERCGNREVRVHLGIDEDRMSLCSHCYNELMADELDVELEQLPESFVLKDFQGVSRTFYVEMRILPNGLFLEAAEELEFGYKFSIHGELECDQQELLSKLIKKTRRAVGKQQVETKSYPNGVKYNGLIWDEFTGRIEYDKTSEGTPLIIIDGRPYTWEEVGKLLMAYEGFQLKLKTYDITDNVD